MEEVEHRLAPDESFQEGFANTFVPTRDFVSIVMILAGCRFYVTTKGRICPVRIDVKEGDEIAIISGAPTPFVLRRACVVNTYTLESDAYVRGRRRGGVVGVTGWVTDCFLSSVPCIPTGSQTRRRGSACEADDDHASVISAGNFDVLYDISASWPRENPRSIVGAVLSLSFLHHHTKKSLRDEIERNIGRITSLHS